MDNSFPGLSVELADVFEWRRSGFSGEKPWYRPWGRCGSAGGDSCSDPGHRAASRRRGVAGPHSSGGCPWTPASWMASLQDPWPGSLPRSSYTLPAPQRHALIIEKNQICRRNYRTRRRDLRRGGERQGSGLGRLIQSHRQRTPGVIKIHPAPRWNKPVPLQIASKNQEETRIRRESQTPRMRNAETAAYSVIPERRRRDPPFLLRPIHHPPFSFFPVHGRDRLDAMEENEMNKKVKMKKKKRERECEVPRSWTPTSSPLPLRHGDHGGCETPPSMGGPSRRNQGGGGRPAAAFLPVDRLAGVPTLGDFERHGFPLLPAPPLHIYLTRVPEASSRGGRTGVGPDRTGSIVLKTRAVLTPHGPQPEIDQPNSTF